LGGRTGGEAGAAAKHTHRLLVDNPTALPNGLHAGNQRSRAACMQPSLQTVLLLRRRLLLLLLVGLHATWRNAGGAACTWALFRAVLLM